MSSRLIPLFPLNVVVFPRTRLPLHIFEERYKEMVGNAIRDDSEFGIVLAKQDGIVTAGCAVSVEKVLRMDPGGHGPARVHDAVRADRWSARGAIGASSTIDQ